MQSGRKYTRKNRKSLKHRNSKHTKSLRRKSHNNKNKLHRSRRMKGGG